MKTKKVLVIASLLFVLAGVASASENFLDLAVNLPIRFDLTENKTSTDFTANVGGDISYTGMITKRIGITFAFSFFFPFANIVNTTNADGSVSSRTVLMSDYVSNWRLAALLGPSFGLINNENCAFLLTPGFAIGTGGYQYGTLTQKYQSVYLGVGIDATFYLMLGKVFYLKTQLQFDAYFWGAEFTNAGGASTMSQNNMMAFAITPAVGFGFRF